MTNPFLIKFGKHVIETLSQEPHCAEGILELRDAENIKMLENSNFILRVARKASCTISVPFRFTSAFDGSVGTFDSMRDAAYDLLKKCRRNFDDFEITTLVVSDVVNVKLQKHFKGIRDNSFIVTTTVFGTVYVKRVK